jgi:3-oxoacyl-[acyl-carrier protein] reductase
MNEVVSYEDKFALVTGSRRGVGRIITEHFLRNGGFVAGFARGESTIAHPNYHHFQVDISDPKAVQRGFADLRKVTDSIHIAINNAAVLTSQYAMIMPAAAAQEMLNVNLMGAFMVSREASKMMRKAKWGRIINISSMAAGLEPIGDSIYCASKAGLASMSNVMAKELAPLNVTCNTLAITAIETDMLAKLSQETIARVISGLPIPRLAKPDDILNVLDFMASERSSYITAQTIYLGGVN